MENLLLLALLLACLREAQLKQSLKIIREENHFILKHLASTGMPVRKTTTTDKGGGGGGGWEWG